MSILKRKALKCTSHHICDCLEYKIQVMERTLRVIRTWGAFDDEGNWPSDPALKPAHIIELCDKALRCLDEKVH
jgi:hypothetical protein